MTIITQSNHKKLLMINPESIFNTLELKHLKWPTIYLHHISASVWMIIVIVRAVFKVIDLGVNRP